MRACVSRRPPAASLRRQGERSQGALLAADDCTQRAVRPLLTPGRVQRAAAAVLSAEPAGATRRQLLALVGTSAVVLRAKPALAKVPAGFNALKDTTKGYAFVYPVGWQARSGGATL